MSDRPAQVVACLWHVTAGEIDRVTIELARRLLALAPGQRVPLLDAVAAARRAATLPALTAGAVVVYGLPTELCGDV